MATNTANFSRLLADAPEAELPLIERTVGSAVIDRLRGTPTSLTGTYQSNGGSNSTTQSVMQTMDNVFKSASHDIAAKTVASAEGVSSFDEAWSKWSVPNGELALVERTIGNAYLARLKGQTQTLSAAYTALGGKDPQSQSVFKTLDSVWQKLDVSNALAAASTLAGNI